ncbi:MAG: hypothetical protein AABZ80_05590 [Gemmatimonadota bacterium]
MARRKLTVVLGGLTRRRKAKGSPAPSELANRWRMGDVGPVAPRTPETGDVIPILDGWIRKLERQAGLDPAANER